MEIVGQYMPRNTILCSVADHPAELKPLLQERTNLLVLHPGLPVPIMNAYSSPETLGMDRLALSVAMQEMYPGKNNLVVCLGTAVTYNFTQMNGTFRGGNITPGLHLRFLSLHEFTDRLPLVNEKGELLLIGYDTDTAIRSGVIFGMAAEIDGMLNNYRAQYPDFNAVLTGGDLSLFAGKLKNKIFADPLLLLKGLNTILNYNVR
jgi:type III pantothenate kinase